ncbi:MAG: LysM peptidoglycan-binding domain-containing protein, partial [Pseudomonadota bacterium]
MSVIRLKTAVANVAILALAACTNGDLDLRGLGDGFETASAARQTTQNRPRPDDRGVISYPNYQMAVARRGDTVRDVAARVGLDATELASYNGLAADTPLRKDEVLALPRRVDPDGNVSSAAAALPAEERIDIAAIATTALDRAPQDPDPGTSITPVAATGPEPIRHKVTAGETAYSISRLHGVSVRGLAEWNGLDSDFTLRAGQFLLIPVRNAPAVSPVTAPGTGSPTPTPPSSTKALPKDGPAPATPTSPLLSASATVASDTSKFLLPTPGKIIRPFIKGKNDGIQIAAAA